MYIFRSLKMHIPYRTENTKPTPRHLANIVSSISHQFENDFSSLRFEKKTFQWKIVAVAR